MGKSSDGSKQQEFANLIKSCPKSHIRKQFWQNQRKYQFSNKDSEMHILNFIGNSIKLKFMKPSSGRESGLTDVLFKLNVDEDNITYLITF